MAKSNQNKINIFEVIKPGFLTTIQDLGRYGYQQYGVSVSGAMDSYSLRIANILLGNDENFAGLEIHYGGIKLKALQSCYIAITGGDLNPMINQQPVTMWRTIKIEKGSILTFEGNRQHKGSISYVAVQGGIISKMIMGSQSTFIKEGISQFFGSKLEKGDFITSYHSPIDIRFSRALNPLYIPQYKGDIKVRFIIGPHQHLFNKESLEKFQHESYQVLPQSDRMGFRLNGLPLVQTVDHNIITDATPVGTIQVPQNGQPIILLADRQPTGGYPKIGTVISVDIPYISQLKPGDQVYFQEISIEESQQLLINQEKFFQELKIGTKKP